MKFHILLKCLDIYIQKDLNLKLRNYNTCDSKESTDIKVNVGVCSVVERYLNLDEVRDKRMEAKSDKKKYVATMCSVSAACFWFLIG